MSTGDKVIVGLSGGVDSAVAAALLLDQGYRVEALFMKNWDEDDEPGHCPAEQDLADARAVAERLDIPLHTVSFSSEYWDRVFAHFLAEYRAGRTPNPDVLCNQEIKFRAFLDYALGLGADWIATGHYARIERSTGGCRLLKGCDPDKDQSYFLYRLGQRALGHSLFPLGELHKPEVRRMARERGFANFAKKDSTGICFIGERRFRDFLARFLPARPGDIVSIDGEILGRHHGLMFHTIGQREGLGIGGTHGGSGEPWYVCAKDLEANHLIVVQGKNHPALFRPTLEADELHWITAAPPTVPFDCHARIRYRQADQACCIIRLEEGRCRVEFRQPQRAVTPGQAVVFYQGEVCLGGGTICA
ncbi:MAG TPA: tRNA 2-thiouridine(34) synthase MnmA [Gammaproteobacteria bacterium]|nr:tRNA 2-thiouridine(34) synthase MnmA [Gammaproteobacteria bacterium]